jgi:hypothetical protein
VGSQAPFCLALSFETLWQLLFCLRRLHSSLHPLRKCLLVHLTFCLFFLFLSLCCHLRRCQARGPSLPLTILSSDSFAVIKWASENNNLRCLCWESTGPFCFRPLRHPSLLLSLISCLPQFCPFSRPPWWPEEFDGLLKAHQLPRADI